MSFLKKLFSVFFVDLQWKILAVFAAAILWLIGMNMSDPLQNLSVSPRLQLDNLHIMATETITVVNEDELRDINVTVTLRALRSDMDRLVAAQPNPIRFADFITASVDFRAIDIAEVREYDGISVQRLRVSPNLQAGFEHLSITPAYVYVELDLSARQLFAVQVEQVGDVPPGFELQHIRPANEFVAVTGSRTDLQMISHVQAAVDISPLHDNTEMLIALQVIDHNGEDMTERVNLNFSETMVNIGIWQVRQLDLRVRGAGTLASGFALAGVSTEHDSISLVGPAEILDELDVIFAEINLSGASSNTTETIDLAEFLPEGVLLRQGEYTEINATARIEPIQERTFTVPRENLRSRGVVGLYRLVDDNASIRVSVSGPQSLISALTAQEIEPEFDLRTLPIGVHDVPLIIGLPPGLTLVGRAPTLLVQIHEPAAAEPEPEPVEYYYEPGQEEYNYYEGL